MTSLSLYHQALTNMLQRMPATSSSSFLSALDFQRDPTLADQFLHPLLTVLDYYTRTRLDCPRISDREFVRLGVLRVLAQGISGRDFLQQQQELFETQLKRSSFFAVLHSKRRRDLLGECSLQLFLRGSRQLQSQDLLARFACLRGRSIWAVDGHQIAHACHALKDKKGSHVAPKSLYLLCLHTGLLHNLSPVQGDGLYRHEMPVFRENLPRWLEKAPSGSKDQSRFPILVADAAYVDKQFWTRMLLLTRKRAVVITRTKENMKPERYSRFGWDARDPVNLGVQGDCRVGFDGAVCMRMVDYVDPETRSAYQFLTTDQSLPPGMIAWLYLMRWRIEKVFDTGKNKLQENKAWATGEVAQEIQGHFFALTHNLLVLFRNYLHSQHGMEELKLIQKREAWLKERERIAREKGGQVHPLHYKTPPVIQLSAQFIRALRNQIIRQTSLADALGRFDAILRAYL